MTNTNILKEYNAYLKKIERVKNEHWKNAELENTLSSRYADAISNAKTLEDRKNTRAQYDAELSKIAEIGEKKYMLRLKLEYMENNRKALLYKAILPAIIEILNRYNGKKYGEKTREKMREDFKTMTGCTFYIQNESYSRDKICFALLDSNGCCYAGDYITIWPKQYEIKILYNNEINGALTAHDFSSYDFKPFIEDVNGQVKKVMKAYKDAEKAREKYAETIHTFNALTVGRMRNIDNPSFLPNTII